MNNSEFCHLHNHDMHSLLDGVSNADSWAKKAKEMGFKYLSITNHGNVDSAIDFQKACEKHKIKSIIGCEAYIVPDLNKKDKNEKRYHIILLVRNNTGWQNLLKLLTIANLDGFYKRPRIDSKTLLEHINGLVVMTACVSTFLKMDGGIDLMKDMTETTYVFFEVMPHNTKEQRDTNYLCLDLINQGFNLDLVATNDCHYLNKEDKETQEVLLAIQRNAKWNDKNRWRFDPAYDLHLKTADEMIKEFRKQGVFGNKDIYSAMQNTNKVVELCSKFKIKKQDIYLPDVKEYKDKNSDELLRSICNENKKTLQDFNIWNKDYDDRLNEEFDLITKKGFSKYFLIVYELVQWCLDNDIMIGPCRGSVGGCLVAYLLGITCIDPVENNLIFSRFISEGRNDYPDIDVDFEDSKRDLVKKHIEELYGENNIAGMSTFQRMKGRAAIRDVARVFDVPYKQVDTFAKVIDDSLDNDSIVNAVKNTKEGKQFKSKYPKAVEFASRLEGQCKSAGQHAAALIISAEDLRNGTRGNLARRSGNIVVNWDMESAEYNGLMKLDALRLSTLSILNDARKEIYKNHNIDLDFESLSLDDEKVLNEFAKGENVGVFQFNTRGIIGVCKDFNIKEFEDLVIINALYRPGTLRSGMLDEYLKRKKGKKWKSFHYIVDDITSKTYGIIVYQEQVMFLVNRLAGMSWSEADKIRKIIGKSKGSKELNKFKDAFVNGCVSNKTLNEKQALELWKTINEFGGYAFNRSHSFGYSMIAYWCQYLKVYYPTEFISVSLTHCGEKQKDELLKEAYRLGLNVITPKVNISDAFKWIAKDNNLYIPFIEINGIGDKTAIEASAFKQTISNISQRGFFKKDDFEEVKKSKIEKILDALKAFDKDIVSDKVDEYFKFQITQNPKVLYPGLFEIIGRGVRPSEVENALIGRIRLQNVFKKVRFNNSELLKCDRCELRNKCIKPVMPSKGLWNIAIIGECPGWREDEVGEGFIHDSGDVLWNELSYYGLKRTKFHVTNCGKCYPGKEIKTPTKEHIQACYPWLREELDKIECRLALVFGNTGLKTFTNRESGIMDLCGATEWNERNKLWISWCIHPASTIYQPSNKDLFKKGIRNFVDTMKYMGLDEILM